MHRDPWLLPTRQAEHPARPVIDDVDLHGRREATFLVLVATFLVTSVIAPIFGATPTIDLARFGLSGHGLPALALPFGVLAVPLGLLAVTLVIELYGLRRASALVAIGLVASLGVAGLVKLGDAAAPRPAAFGAALAFASYLAVAHIVNLALFAGVSRRSRGGRMWLRASFGIIGAQLAGWAAFAFVMYSDAVVVRDMTAAGAAANVTALVLAGAGYVSAVALVAMPVVALVARGLAIYLRVGHWQLVDDDIEDEAPAPRHAFVRHAPPPPPRPQPQPQPAKPQHLHDRSGRHGIQPFTSAEMRFFTEGDMLDPGDSGELPKAQA
jgi:uncharacterized PurR-regulated membrane protein YhhQ (DUF165 family)